MEGIVPVVHSLVSVSRAEICQTVGCFDFYDIYFSKEEVWFRLQKKI